MDKAQKEVDLLAKKLELYYMKLLKKYNYRIFGFSCKTKKEEKNLYIEDIKSMLNILLDQYEKTANK